MIMSFRRPPKSVKCSVNYGMRCLLRACLFVIACSQAVAQDQTAFSIPQATLERSLIEFVKQSGTGVLVNQGVDTTVLLPAVNGTFSPEAALNALLANASLIAQRIDNGSFVISQRTLAPTFTENYTTIEEVIVTGTNINRGLHRMVSPVTMIDKNDLQHLGSPSMIDLIATLSSMSGTENQSNQFHNVNNAGTANVNLRGLGVSRTLVLLNGKRMVQSALPHNDGQAFVDINTIPALALERIDILKNGASATYGSDAVAGVVNFITRREVSGFETAISGKHIDESDGEWNAGFITGGDIAGGQWMASMNYNRRNELRNRDREDVIAPKIDIPAFQRSIYGISSVGNPGSFIPVSAEVAMDGITALEAANAAQGGNNYVRDPQCEQAGGFVFENARCGFNYVEHDNLVETEDRWQWFTSWYRPLGPSSELYAELNYSYLELEEWKTSPSFPPVNEVDVARFVPAYHPGLIDFLERNPELLENDGDTPNFSGGALFVGRPMGASGTADSGWRSHNTLRIVTGLRGVLPQGMDYNLSLALAQNTAKTRTPDVLIDRWEKALSGFGGENCTGSTAGENQCLFYNPFASASLTGDGNDPSLANNNDLLAWLKEDVIQQNTSNLLVADMGFSGRFTMPMGIPVDYAFGLQYRSERLKIRFDDLSDVNINPGHSTAPGELPGIFIFFRGGQEDQVQQDVFAWFTELATPVRDNLTLQLALRYESYGGNIGESVDPRIALNWSLSPTINLNLSAGTTFRAPSLNQTSLDTTHLELIGAEFAFKAVDRVGNETLLPETSISTSVSVLWDPNEFWTLELDYWNYHLQDVIVQESANALVNTVFSNPDSERLSQIIFDGSGNISRIISHYVNGPNINVDGIDFSGQYLQRLPSGRLSVGWDIAWLHRYDVGKSALSPAFSAAGKMNTGTFVKSLPRWRGNLYINYAHKAFNARIALNAISAYVDDGLNILDKTAFQAFITEERVNRHYSLDTHVSWQWPSAQTRMSLSVLNVTDRNPPPARLDMRFDTTLHNAFGRMVKVTLQHKL
mgnify:CR=1 FL=1